MSVTSHWNHNWRKPLRSQGSDRGGTCPPSGGTDWYAGNWPQSSIFSIKSFIDWLIWLHSMAYDLSSLTRDQTRAPCSGSMDSSPSINYFWDNEVTTSAGQLTGLNEVQVPSTFMLGKYQLRGGWRKEWPRGQSVLLCCCALLSNDRIRENWNDYS